MNSIPPAITEKLSELLALEFSNSRRISVNAVSSIYQLLFGHSDSYILKLYADELELMDSEVSGLKLLSTADVITPKIIDINNGLYRYVQKYIDSKSPTLMHYQS